MWDHVKPCPTPSCIAQLWLLGAAAFDRGDAHYLLRWSTVLGSCQQASAPGDYELSLSLELPALRLSELLQLGLGMDALLQLFSSCLPLECHLSLAGCMLRS